MISPSLAPLLQPGTRYDDATALHLGEFAQAVYARGDDFWEYAIAGGYQRPVIVQEGATQIGCAVGRYGLMVACRGSSERVDWIENGQAWRVGWRDVIPGGAGVHRGFLKQVKRMRKRLAAKVRIALDGRTDSYPIYACGHSLGGAIAPLVVLCLAADLHMRLEALYTFESPRPGNEEFSRWWDDHSGSVTHRVVTIRRGVADIVTRVPPSACGWWHIGRPQMIRDGYRFESEEEWEIARAKHPVGALPGWRFLSRLRECIIAHDMFGLLRELRVIHGRLMQAAPPAVESLR